MHRPLAVALFGAGIFAKDAYLRVFREAHEDAKLVAVWSRSREAAEGILASIREFASDAVAAHGDEQLVELLARTDIDAVVVVLPVQAMRTVTAQALKAGKHVLQEKPVGGSLDEVLVTLNTYRNADNLPLWAIAENYRSEAAFCKAQQLIEHLGTVIKIDLSASMPMNQQNKYYSSAWRRDAEGCPGGFLTDAGVHYVAALRLLARAAGFGEVATVAARSRTVDSGLPSPDTAVAMCGFDNGAAGSMSVTFAAPDASFSLRVTGSKGSVEVSRGGWGRSSSCYTLRHSLQGQGAQEQELPFDGLQAEFAAFVQLVQARKWGEALPPDAAFRVSVEEGARDLAVVDALLQSCRQGGAPTAVRIV